jgi:putative oxygen-independent coproporphyrinogen III oxidase
VHLPFCAHRCDYCSFSVFTDRHHLHRDYVDALLREIASAAENGACFRSVFIGGGTPSLIDPSLLTQVLRALPTVDGAEVTVESNPDDVTEAWVSALRDAGMTRLSLGVQSTVDHVLASLNRRHDRANVATAVAAVQRVGVPSLNVDLIYGAVGESLDDWRQSVDEAISWGTTHVSAYALTVEGGTALATDAERAPDEDDQADKYELASELLGAAGFANYEVSNWARAGFECAHNWTYWRQGSYLGFGCAAHSHVDGHRWWNVRTPDRYIDKITSGASPVSASERLDPGARELEALQLSLRTREGVPARSFSDADLADLVAGGLVEVRDSTARLSVRGRLVANAVTHLLRVPGSPDEA